MRLLRSEIVGHFGPKGERYAVYSMDVQPNSNRLATGGGDFCVKLWNLDALLSSPTNVKEALLATLSSHTKSVNIVRWSRDGKLIASGSDDNYILVHKYTPGALSNQSFGSNNSAAKNKETWSRCYTLQGHSMDVLDLDWLPGSVENGYTLASASVDNKILIWHLVPGVNNGSGHNFSSQVAPRQILSGHHSFVKGLSFDPMGRFLLSSGSDNRLIVWDVQNDYSIVRTLDEPLRNSPDKTIFRRISWAPDGQSVCITSAQKSNKPVGMVLKRGTWESVADLVGHAASSISAKFCPHVLQYTPPTANAANGTEGGGSKPPTAPIVACTVALGDQNGVVSIWSTHSNRPLYVLRDICDGAITDIAWARTASQTIVAVCGIDGTVMVADLQGEIGRCMPQAVLERHFQSLYGRNAAEMQQRPQALVESAVALRYAQQPPPPAAGAAVPANGAVKKRIDLSAQSNVIQGQGTASAAAIASPMSTLAHRSGINNGNNATTAGGPNSPATLLLQQTSQTIGGKKRIRPVLMQNNLDSPDEVTAAVVGGGTASTVRMGASAGSIPVRVPDFSSGNHANGDGSDGGDGGGNDEVFGTAMDVGNSNATKRARPSSSDNLIQRSGHAGTSGSATVFAAANNSAAVAASVHVGTVTTAAVAPAVSSSALRTPVAERFLTIHFDQDEMLCTIPLLNTQQRIRRAVAQQAAHAHPQAVGSSSSSRSNRLGTMPAVAGSQLVVTAQRLTKPSVLAQLRHSGGPLSAVVLSSFSSTALVQGAAPASLWSAVVAGEVTCIAAAERPHEGAASTASATSSGGTEQLEGLCLVGSSDGTLQCLSLSCGMRIGAPMVLGCSLAYLDLRADSTAPGHFAALAVTADGEAWKWSVCARTAKFRCALRTSLRPVLLSMKCHSSVGQSRLDKVQDKNRTPASGAGGTQGATALGGKDRNKGSSSTAAVTTAGAATDSAGQRNTKQAPAAGTGIKVQQCMLTERGDIQVHLQVGSGSSGVVEGGAWQAFVYDGDAQVWQRMADMRYVLSSLFAVKAVSAVGASPIVYADSAQDGGSHGIAAPPNSVVGADGASLSTLQSLAAAGAGFGARDVVSIAAAKQAALHAALSVADGTAGAAESRGTGSLRDLGHTVAANGGGGGGSGGDRRSGGKIAPSAEEWVSLATISHVEDRLAVAQALGSAEEIEAWLLAWIETCCKNGLDGRVRWLARQLIDLHLSNNKSTAGIPESQAVTSPHQHGSSLHRHDAKAGHSSCFAWLSSQPHPLALLQGPVMRTIAKFPSAHALLAEISHTLDMLKMG